MKGLPYLGTPVLRTCQGPEGTKLLSQVGSALSPHLVLLLSFSHPPPSDLTVEEKEDHDGERDRPTWQASLSSELSLRWDWTSQ
jgi:hypothetical protein